MLRTCQNKLSLTDANEAAIGGGMSLTECSLRVLDEVLRDLLVRRARQSARPTEKAGGE
jgi:hypothetical protein